MGPGLRSSNSNRAGEAHQTVLRRRVKSACVLLHSAFSPDTLLLAGLCASLEVVSQLCWQTLFGAHLDTDGQNQAVQLSASKLNEH